MSRKPFARLIISAVLAPALFAFVPEAANSCACAGFNPPEPKASDFNPIKGLEFTRTPEYHHEFQTAVDSARLACKQHLGEKRLAIVSDLDETLLDNREESRLNPEGNKEQFFQWVAQSQSAVLKPTADFLSWARKNGFAIFFVTGRNEAYRAATIANLLRYGIAYDGLYMRADGDKRPAAQVKPEFRQGIEKMGFKIVVNIGDQVSDLVGGHADDCELLPNKMYLVR